MSGIKPYHKISVVLAYLYLSSIFTLHAQSECKKQLQRFSKEPKSAQWDSLINFYAKLERKKSFAEAEKYGKDLELHFRKTQEYEGLWKLLNHQMLIATDQGHWETASFKKQQLLELKKFNLPKKYELEQQLNFGYLAYFQGNYDAALENWKTGLDLSLNAPNSIMLVYQFYSNLGAAYFSKNYLRTAAHYYLLALQHAEKHTISHNDLYNNLAAVSISSRDFTSAKQYLEKIPFDSIQDPYLRIEIQTNRLKTALLSKDTALATSLYPWLTAHLNDFPPLRSFVLATLMEYHILFESYSYEKFLSRFPELYEISENTLDQVLSVWSEYPDYVKILPREYLKKLESIDIHTFNETIFADAQLCLAYWSGESRYWETYEALRRKRLENLDSLLIRDLSANLRTIKLEFEREELQANLQRMKTERYLMISFSLLVFTLFGILTMVYRKSLKRKVSEQLLTKELMESQKTQLAYSQNIMGKAQDWLKEIQHILQNTTNYESRKRLQTLKNDFSILGKVNERNQKREEHEPFEKNSPSELHRLNKTELTVARYLMRGMKTKEIGIFMELSPVYINNVRYKIRKKLDIPKELSVEEYLENLSKNM